MRSSQSTLFRSTSPAVPASPWHRVDVCTSTALARTRVSLLGVLDRRAIETIDNAVRLARVAGHTLTVELAETSSVTPGALAALLARVQAPALKATI